MSERLARVGLEGRSETRLFLIALARALKARHGSAVHLYLGNRQEADYYARHGEGAFDSIEIDGEPLAGAREADIDEAAALAEAQAWERRLGVTYNRLAISNRHLGRGYALGGYRHPRSRISETAGYPQLLNGFNRALAFWDREISNKRLTCLVNGPLQAALVARAHGVPYRVLAGSRYRNLHYWAHNELFETPEFEAAYRAGEGAASALDKPYHSHLVSRARFLAQAGLAYRLRRSALEIARFAWWRLRGYEKARGYYLGENLRYFANVGREWRSLDRLATARLEDLEGPFVYYPLHMEPEMALQGLSPEYFSQLSLIAALSRDLPAGVRLAVKETPAAVGRRPRDFYGQIADLKNVVMLDSRELGLRCIERCRAVVTICGTAGFEGAVLGKPVIALGRHNIYNFLPHVWTARGEDKLRACLEGALSEAFDRDRAKASGRRFLAAVAARSFDMGAYDFVDVASFDEAAVSAACDALERSLADGEGKRRPAQVEAAS